MIWVFYRHDVVRGEARVFRPQFSKQLLEQLDPTLSRTRGEVGLEGLHQLTRDYMQSAYILQNSNFLKGEHKEETMSLELSLCHAVST